MNNRLVILHLSLIDKVGSATISKIVERLRERSVIDLSLLYTLNAEELGLLADISPALAQTIVTGLADTKKLHKEYDLIQKHAFYWYALGDAEYPAILKNIHVPPAVLYVRGKKIHEIAQPTVALVGSRMCDAYGMHTTKTLVEDLVHAGIATVSGGARGIDTVVHKTTQNLGGHTLVVIGSGLLRPYPAQNEMLFDAIAAEHGSIISPFPLMMEALPGNFPARNRIIAGLSSVCVVVQAAQKSGALITAKYALEQGREVGAVPGAIDNPLSAGCHALIRDGAGIITSGEDIRALLPAYIPRTQEKRTADISCELLQVEIFSPPHEPLTTVQKPEDEILGYISQKALSCDELVGLTKASIAQVQDSLWSLQLEGVVTQNFMGLWQKV